MKKIFLIIICLIVSILNIYGICFKNTKMKINENVKTDSSNFISMMLENENGEYIEKTDLKFPIENYLFNPKASGCENGGTLSWNNEKQKIIS